MKTLTLTLSGVLLATSAMIAPGMAHAQTPPPVATAPQSSTAQTPAVQALLRHLEAVAFTGARALSGLMMKVGKS